MEQRIRYFKTEDGVNIAYTTFGQGSPLVFANGCWLSTSYDLDDDFGGAFYRAIAEHFTIVCYDRRGSGMSDRSGEDYTVEADTSDLEALVEHLDLEEFVLFGNCGLGPAAICYATRHPERLSHLVLYAAYARGTSLADDETRELFVSMAKSNWGIASRTLADIFVPDAEGDIVERLAHAMRDTYGSEVASKHLEALYAADVTDLLAAVTTPTLILNKERDRGVSYRMARVLAADIPDSHLVLLAGRTHLFWHGDFTPMLDAMMEFLGEPAQANIPTRAESGTAIILFADIANSTALTEQLGDAAFRKSARELDSALRDAITSVGGTPIEGKLLGDGVLATFDAARTAIECAHSCHASAQHVGLQLHVGIHAGDVIREDGNVFGGAVNIAARVSDASDADETLVSQTVRDLARTSANVIFQDRGEHQLKGIDEPQRLFAVRAEPPPARSTETG